MSVSEQLRAFLPVDIQDAEGNLTRKVSGAPITAAAIAEIADEAERLEQLCRDMHLAIVYSTVREVAVKPDVRDYYDGKMQDLGLLEDD